jgi:hypothetical protein
MARSENAMELPKEPVGCAGRRRLRLSDRHDLAAGNFCSTSGRSVDLSRLKGTTVVCIYPRFGPGISD